MPAELTDRVPLMMTKYLSPRLIFLYVFLICALLLLVAFFMEYSMGLEPCPLCMTQRVFFLLTGLAALAAFIHNPASTGRMIYGFACTVLALGGSYFAGRQIWLQGLPEDEVPACGPSLSYMFEVFPLGEVITTMLTGDGNCAEVVWQDPVLQLSIPQWTITFFVLLAAVGIYQAVRKPA